MFALIISGLKMCKTITVGAGKTGKAKDLAENESKVILYDKCFGKTKVADTTIKGIDITKDKH